MSLSYQVLYFIFEVTTLVSVMVVVLMEVAVFLLIPLLKRSSSLWRIYKTPLILHLHQDLRLRHTEQGILMKPRLELGRTLKTNGSIMFEQFLSLSFALFVYSVS